MGSTNEKCSNGTEEETSVSGNGKKSEKYKPFNKTKTRNKIKAHIPFFCYHLISTVIHYSGTNIQPSTGRELLFDIEKHWLKRCRNHNRSSSGFLVKGYCAFLCSTLEYLKF